MFECDRVLALNRRQHPCVAPERATPQHRRGHGRPWPHQIGASSEPFFNFSWLWFPLILLDRFEPSLLRFAAFAGPPSDEVRPPLSSSVEHPRRQAPLSPHRMSLTARAPMLFRCPSLPARPWAHGQRFFLHVARDNLCCCNE